MKWDKFVIPEDFEKVKEISSFQEKVRSKIPELSKRSFSEKRKDKLEKNIAIIINKKETRIEDLSLKVKTIFHKNFLRRI